MSDRHLNSLEMMFIHAPARRGEMIRPGVMLSRLCVICRYGWTEIDAERRRWAATSSGILCSCVAWWPKGMQARRRKKDRRDRTRFSFFRSSRTLQTQDKSEKQKVKWIIIMTVTTQLRVEPLSFCKNLF